MPITPQEALQRTIEHREVFHDEMLHIVRLIMSGECSPVMMAALITGLRVKKETIGEITAAAQVMREFSTKVEVADRTHLVDIVGTGGDGSHTFNISTTAMFVAAAAGAKVSKHGGRSVSSKSGSADVMESLGININAIPVNSGWALAGAWMARRNAVQKGMHWLDRIAGAMFIAFGLKLAFTDNPSR